MQPSTIATVLFFVAFVSMFLAIRRWTSLVRLEYDRYRTIWLDDGCPRSNFWRPPQAEFVTSWIATNILMVRWLFRTPSWVGHDPEASRFLRSYRTYFAVAIVFLLAAMAAWSR